MPKPLSRQSKQLIANLINYFERERDNQGPLLPLNAVKERVANALARTRFLQSYMRNQNLPSPHEIVFMDETWVFQNRTVSRSWQDDCKKSVKKTRVDGQRYIVVHAGNKNGFISGASLICSSTTKNPDYHGEMNQHNFLVWFENQLLKNLEEPSIIVIDNASYHNTLVDKIPTRVNAKYEDTCVETEFCIKKLNSIQLRFVFWRSLVSSYLAFTLPTAWTKPNIKEWLQNRNIRFEDNLLKIELLDLVARNKPPKTFVVDQLAEKYGHKVLRLPAYHCMFNAIENIWPIAKGYYNKYIGRDGYGTDKALLMWREALDAVTPQMWSNTVEHTEKEIKKWWEREVLFDREDVQPLIINFTNDSDSSNYSSDSD